MSVDLYSGRRLVLLSTHIVLILLTTSFVCARFAAKRMRQLGASLDDGLLLAGLSFSPIYRPLLPSWVVVILCSAVGIADRRPPAFFIGQVGYHIQDITLAQLERTLLLLWVGQFPMCLAITFTRCSISVFFVRIFFTHTFPRLRCLAYTSIALSIGWLIVCICVAIFHCRPIPYNWTPPIEDPAYCFPMKSYTIVMAAWGLVMDALIWSLPHFVVWKLRLRPAHKIAITFIFALGVLNIIIAICRIQSLTALDWQRDLTYSTVSALIWAVAQTNTAIILACCPLLRPVFEKLVPRRLTRVNSIAPTHALPAPNLAIQRDPSLNVHDDAEPPRCRWVHDGLDDADAPIWKIEMHPSPRGR